jgi:AcrR family transcriptional regulator
MKNKEIKSSKTENEAKKPTKERIFDVSIDLFSQKGFDAVSVREIAREVGIRESSIYNHYQNKEAILDAITDYFMSELAQSGENVGEMDELISQGPEVFFEVGGKAFIERMGQAKNEKIWRIIAIEIFHNEKIRSFFRKELLEEPINGWENIFSIMIGKKLVKPYNPRTLAYEYFSFAIFLFFEYFVLKYDDDFESFMDLALIKMADHAEFILEAIKI